MKIRPTVLTALVNPLVARLALLLALYAPFLAPPSDRANLFLPKAGEAVTTVRVATYAVSGGFVHRHSYVEQLSKSGFLKELWGADLR